MSYNTPKVTIDLEEYQELQAYRDFKINSKDLKFEPIRLTDHKQLTDRVGGYALILSDNQVQHSSIATAYFTSYEIEKLVLNDWEIKFIKKEKK